VEAYATNGIPIGSTVMLEPVMTGPMTTAHDLSSRAQSRSEHETVVEEAAQRNGSVSNEMAAQRAATMSAEAQAQIACSLDDPDSCEMCSG